MRPLYLILGLVGFTLADGIGHNHRQGRRGGRAFRRGRQEDLSAAPLGSYGAESALDSYGSGELSARDAELAALSANIPGVPGEDYPIYAEVPESEFSCDGQVDGGYYADPSAECQVFHICTSDGKGGLAKYSFLCPNGTIFNQNYFICDWWFNFDCAEAETLYSLNDDIAAERAAASGALDSYGAPSEESEVRSDYGAPRGADAGYGAPAREAELEYAAPVEEIVEERLPAYDEQPAYESQASYDSGAGDLGPIDPIVEVRSGRARQGRRQGRRQGGRRNNNRRGGRQFQGFRG